MKEEEMKRVKKGEEIKGESQPFVFLSLSLGMC